MPKFELKKFHENRGHEGLGYDCDLYMDGVLVCHSNNEGGGGPDMHHFVSKEMRDKVMAHIATLPPHRWTEDDIDMEDSPMDMDLFMMELVGEFQANKAFKRQCKTKTLFRLKTDKPNEYHVSKQVFTAKIAEGMRKHYGDQLLEIINERFL
jgi:hypothetical protein